MNHLGIQAECHMVFDLHDSIENSTPLAPEAEAMLMDTLWRQLAQARKPDWHAGVCYHPPASRRPLGHGGHILSTHPPDLPAAGALKQLHICPTFYGFEFDETRAPATGGAGYEMQAVDLDDGIGLDDNDDDIDMGYGGDMWDAHEDNPDGRYGAFSRNVFNQSQRRTSIAGDEGWEEVPAGVEQVRSVVCWHAPEPNRALEDRTHAASNLGLPCALQTGDIVVSLSSRAPDEYTYFNKALFNNWAGPDHWRPSARAGGRFAGKDGAEKKKAVKAKFAIDFFGADSTDWGKAFAVSKATTLAQSTLTKHDGVCTYCTDGVQPCDSHGGCNGCCTYVCRPVKHAADGHPLHGRAAPSPVPQAGPLRMPPARQTRRATGPLILTHACALQLSRKRRTMEEGQLIGLGEGGGYDYSNERDQGYCPDFDSDDQGEGYSGDEADPGPREGHFLTADGRSFHVCSAGLMHAYSPLFVHVAPPAYCRMTWMTTLTSATSWSTRPAAWARCSLATPAPQRRYAGDTRVLWHFWPLACACACNIY
jgi:hypothetical protein